MSRGRDIPRLESINHIPTSARIGASHGVNLPTKGDRIVTFGVIDCDAWPPWGDVDAVLTFGMHMHREFVVQERVQDEFASTACSRGVDDRGSLPDWCHFTGGQVLGRIGDGIDVSRTPTPEYSTWIPITCVLSRLMVDAITVFREPRGLDSRRQLIRKTSIPIR